MREFVVSAGGQTILGGQAPLIQMSCGVGAFGPGIEILRAWAAQTGNVSSAEQRVRISQIAGLLPPATAFLPVPLKPVDSPSVVTAGINATSGTIFGQTFIDQTFNVLNGWATCGDPATGNPLLGYRPSTDLTIGLFFPIPPVVPTNWCFGWVFREIA